jgi:hypothetical protein
VSKLIKHMQCEGMLLLRQPVVVGVVRFTTLTRQKKKSSVLIVSNGVLYGAVEPLTCLARERSSPVWELLFKLTCSSYFHSAFGCWNLDSEFRIGIDKPEFWCLNGHSIWNWKSTKFPPVFNSTHASTLQFRPSTL